MKEPKDKRTKAYKDWKKSQAKLQQDIDNGDAYIEKGLGDKIEEITEKTGIKKAVKKIFGDDCGCEERKQKLNKVVKLRFPVVRCMTEEQAKQWESIKDKPAITQEEQKTILIPIYKHLFARQLKVMSCCLNQFMNDIDRVYNY